MAKRFLLVDSDALPNVFMKVIEAKECLTTGKARNITQAAKLVGVSRSALYKYKDSVFDIGNNVAAITLYVRLRDEPGALQALLTVLSNAGANVITINQSAPQNSVADVSVVCSTGSMKRSIEDVLVEISKQPAVIDVRRALQDLNSTEFMEES